MKHVKKAILSIGVVGIIGVMQFADNSIATTKGKVTAETIRLRSEATTNSSIVELLSEDDEVEIISEKGDWYKVSYKDKTGYVSKQYVKKLKSANNNTTNNSSVAKNTTNTTKKNTTNSSTTNNKVTTSNNAETNNTNISVEENNTAQENSNQEENKVDTNQSSDELNNTVETNQENTTEDDKQENNDIVSNDITKDITEREFKENETIQLANEVNIKILPLINSSNINNIKKDATIKVVQIMNKWCYIEADSSTGWISNKELNSAIKLDNDIQDNKNEVSSTQSEENDTKKDTESNETSTSEKTVDTTEKNSKDNTTNKTSTKNSTTTNKTGYVNVDTVNVRKKANSDSDVVDCITKNTKVTILGEEDAWYKVKAGSIQGYIAKKYISDKKVETTSRSSTTSRKEDKKNETKNTTDATTTEKSQESKTPENQSTTTNKKETSENTSSASTSGSGVVSYAKQYLGCKYVSGGTSPKGFDCSGFTSYVYKHFGVSLSRTSSAQASNGSAVQRSNLLAGDLVLFKGSSGKSIGHVGIYIGGNQFIHASTPSKGVIISSLSESYYATRYVTARRIL